MNKFKSLQFELEREESYLREMMTVVDTREPFLTGENSRFIMKGKKEFINRKKVKEQKSIIQKLKTDIENEQKNLQPAQPQKPEGQKKTV